jgi:hypothetical protein
MDSVSTETRRDHKARGELQLNLHYYGRAAVEPFVRPGDSAAKAAPVLPGGSAFKYGPSEGCEKILKFVLAFS